MLENDRDEINFHKFLKSVRKAQGVSMEKMALGVCTKSEMSRVENGTRLPDKLVRDRLTARLGISGEEYEEYLLPREYEQWERRMEIIRCINKKDVAGAEEKITAYETLYNKNGVEKQFVEAMRFMVLEMKGASEEELFDKVRVALECTVPDMDAALDGAHPLADQELNLIMEYIRLKKAVVPERNLTEWKLKEYHKIVVYVQNSRMDKIAQAKVYSKLACYVADLVLAEYVTEESLRYALELCTRAIEVLRDTFRLYYFVELNEYRMKIIERIHICIKGIKEDEKLNEIHLISKEWISLLSEMYTENTLSIYMENDTYLYTETECNNARDVIRIRRAMLKIPRRKFTGHACDEKTLMRLELEQGNPSMVTVREIFDMLGICAEYKRARVVTSDADTMYLSQKLFKIIDDYKHEDAMRCIEKLYECVDVNIPYNEQKLMRQKLMVARREKVISNENQIELITDVLECTLSLSALMSLGEKYFTRTEIECVHDFATHTKGEEQVKCREIMERMCLDVLDTEFDSTYFCVYELIMNRMACIYGNEGEYEKSNQMSNKLLKESLRNRKSYSLTGCVYNNLWNYQQMNRVDKDYVVQILHKCLILSVIANQYGWKDFLQQKIKELE